MQTKHTNSNNVIDTKDLSYLGWVDGNSNRIVDMTYNYVSQDYMILSNNNQCKILWVEINFDSSHSDNHTVNNSADISDKNRLLMCLTTSIFTKSSDNIQIHVATINIISVLNTSVLHKHCMLCWNGNQTIIMEAIMYHQKTQDSISNSILLEFEINVIFFGYCYDYTSLSIFNSDGISCFIAFFIEVVLNVFATSNKLWICNREQVLSSSKIIYPISVIWIFNSMFTISVSIKYQLIYVSIILIQIVALHEAMHKLNGLLQNTEYVLNIFDNIGTRTNMLSINGGNHYVSFDNIFFFFFFPSSYLFNTRIATENNIVNNAYQLLPTIIDGIMCVNKDNCYYKIQT